MKKIIIYILAFFLKTLVLAKKIFAPIISNIFKIMGRLLFFAILPIYNGYLIIKRVFIKFYSPIQNKHKIIHVFARRYIIHVLIIIISLLVTTTNLNAYEVKKDDNGYNNILSRLVEKEDYDILQVEKPSNATRVARYYQKGGIEKNSPINYDGISGAGPEILSTGGALKKPILSPVESIARAKNEMVYYAVEAGDTISDIGQKFGISVNTILWENKLTGYSIIRPGQILTILPTSGIRHKVAKGDTLDKIAKKYSSEAEDIIEYNKLASAKDLKIGELLIVPGGRKPSETPTYSLRWGSSAQSNVTSKVLLAVGKMIWPSTCKRITQYYTWRHTGIDIACGYGNPVKAANGGTVVRAQGGWNGGYGLMIIIDHGNGEQSLYGHLSRILVGVGDVVSQGQIIAAEGSSGRSTGPHVHFEVRKNGIRRNPLSSVK